jgi:ankyrin repeat protein
MRSDTRHPPWFGAGAVAGQTIAAGLVLWLVGMLLGCMSPPDKEYALIDAVMADDMERVRSSLDDAHIDVNWVVPYTGDTALSSAAAFNRVTMVEFLLSRGADPNVIGEGGLPALHSAAYHGYATVVRMLIDAGANVNAVETRHGFTALAEASRNGHIQVMKTLLDAGADRSIRTSGSRTPWELAEQYGKHDAADLLRRYRKPDVPPTE